MKIVTLHGLHQDLLKEIKKKIKFGSSKLKYVDELSSHVIEFKFADKTGSKRSEGGIRTTIENLVNILHKSLHEVNKKDENYIIDTIISAKMDQIENLKKKIRSEKRGEKKHSYKKTLKHLKEFTGYFENNCVNKIVLDHSLTELSFMLREKALFLTNDPKDYKMKKTYSEADDVRDQLDDSEDDSDVEYTSLGIRKDAKSA